MFKKRYKPLSADAVAMATNRQMQDRGKIIFILQNLRFANILEKKQE